MTEPQIIRGFPEAEREAVARAFWEAFEGKLGRVLGPEAKALAFLRAALRSDFAFTVLDADGHVLGAAGFKTEEGGLVSAGYSDLAAVYGRVGAMWRGPLLDLMERSLAPGQMLMDGIFVSSRARGTGLGTRLIEAIVEEAAERGLRAVRLDVIDTNPRARALYERMGFEAVAEERLGPLRFIFGFRRSTTMLRYLPEGRREQA